MLYGIRHVTTYHYSDVVSLAHNEARLLPRDSDWQVCRAARVGVEPTTAMSRRQDWFGNPVVSFTLQEPHRTVVVTADSEVEVTAPPAPQPEQTPAWETVRDGLPLDRSRAGLEAYQYVFDSVYAQAVPTAVEFAQPSFTPGRPLLAACVSLCERFFEEFTRDTTATTVHTHVREVFEIKRGVCQDYAQAMIACLRGLGLSARYVSGYLRTRPPPGRPRLLGADASHAWLSVWCPPIGWVDLDPFNNLIVSDQHISLAWGRDYDDVAPIKGVIIGGGRHTVRVAVDVEPLDDEPRE